MPKAPKPPRTRRPTQFDWKAMVAAATARAHAPSAPVQWERVGQFGPNPGDLGMWLHRPEHLPENAPLVVVLHGCGQSAAAYAHGAGWTALADRLGFAIVAPEQDRANNMNGCFNWFQPEDVRRGQGEAASIRQMAAYAVSHHKLDARRVFITGLSAGGAMTAAMLAAYPEAFAGGAIIAGLPFGAAGSVQEALSGMRAPPARSARAWGDCVRKASSHRGAWPRVSVWHGDVDHTVSDQNAEMIVAQWLDVHGLGGPPTAVEEVDGYPRRSWRGADGGRLIESYSLTGMGHGVPISTEGPDGYGFEAPFILDVGISSSLRIAEFWNLTSAVAGEKAASTASNALVETRSPEDYITVLDFQPVPKPGPRAPAMGFDPKAVIEKALRAAGLM